METLRRIAHILIDEVTGSPTKEIIREYAEIACAHKGNTEVNLVGLIAQLEADYGVGRSRSSSLTGVDIMPWLKDKKGSIEWRLWQRYVSYLSAKNASVNTRDLDDITDKILDKCADPKTPGRWDRRGMVVGNVQSGKTGNYTGVINKAIDCGYKMVIVIAGTHKSLRRQTQERIDDGFIGVNSASGKRTGVGAYGQAYVYSYTTSHDDGDFSRDSLRTRNVPIAGEYPTIIVIKKNKNILENLILWLAQFAQTNVDGERKIYEVPVLIIDDEADSASVNSGTEEDVRTINRYIRVLLNLFDQKAFIGYTATPYANLFIPSSWKEELSTSICGKSFKVGEDLFPRDFIINIHPPSNYIGATEVFGHGEAGSEDIRDPLPIIRDALDQEPYFPLRITKENRDDLPEGIPVSLRCAIQSFILTCAIRRLRGQASNHNSMLVHVALRVAWIDRIARLVNETLHDYRNQILLNAGPLLRDLERLFREDFVDTTNTVLQNLMYSDPAIVPMTWESVKAELQSAISKIEVRAVHGQKKARGLEYPHMEELNYDQYEGKGLNVIAVGGNKLARGLTLEGLSVSYYLRTTRMYDSLMQMGRWFGYRPGYVDLCRLFTTAELQVWYEHVAMATDEMRADFDVMASQNKTPGQFQIKVKKHPGMLMITSAAKMKGHETLELSYSGQLKQTYAFSDKADDVANNYRALQNLLGQLPEPALPSSASPVNSVLWRGIEARHVIDFLASYNGLGFFPGESMRGYVLQQNSSRLLTQWNVAIILNSRSQHNHKIRFRDVRSQEFKWSTGSMSGGMPARSLQQKGDVLIVGGSKNAILDKRARSIDLNLSTPVESISEHELRSVRKSAGVPLLVILPLDPRVSAAGHAVPIVGVGVQFPEIEGEVAYKYAVRPMAGMEDEVQESDDPADA